MSSGDVVGGMMLDALLGDPPTWPHAVRFIGASVRAGERIARKHLSKHEFLAGALVTTSVVGASFVVTRTLLRIAKRVSPPLGFVVGALVSCQCIAARCLADEAENVRSLLAEGKLQDARDAVAMLVGRDTQDLDETGVARACVETIAENTCDAVVAPLFFLALGGPAAGVAYKAVNTLDSMIGYHNERYVLFGRFAAKLDDTLNFIPARLCGVFMVGAAALLRFDWRCAFRTLKRDRLHHISPNSGHGEAACAGALGITLGGSATYGSKPSVKPYINATGVPVTPHDIKRATQLMVLTGWLCAGSIGLVGALARHVRRAA